MKAVVLLSGGIDSTTLAYSLKSQGYDLTLLSFNYKQRHIRELRAAGAIAIRLNSPRYTINLTSMGKLLDSSLTNPSATIPEGHYEAESMKDTVVPNRNAIFLSIAFGIAASIGATIVGTAVHAGDHAIYPDCRPDFLDSFEKMEQMSLRGIADHIEIRSPFVNWTKTAIVKLGLQLHVPYELTWSCYNGRAKHCGKCGTCVERLEAFEACGTKDPVEYE